MVIFFSYLPLLFSYPILYYINLLSSELVFYVHGFFWVDEGRREEFEVMLFFRFFFLFKFFFCTEEKKKNLRNQYRILNSFQGVGFRPFKAVYLHFFPVDCRLPSSTIRQFTKQLKRLVYV